MSALLQIIEGVKADEATRRLTPGKLAEKIAAAPKAISALEKFKSREFSVIAEIKRSSPSKGQLAQIPEPAALAKIYQEGGATAISVLTEGRKFKGSLIDLMEVREAVDIPILRKDFMVSEYLVQESRAYGADLILLIVAALDDHQLKDYFQIAEALGMSALIEVHDQYELERALAIDPKMIGVNSRNLKTLEINSEVFAQLIPLIPNQIIRIAESGIFDTKDVVTAQNLGADAILVGEALVRANSPKEKIEEFLTGVNTVGKVE
ncbi:MAG: indole-3-glycerol phosphate synthase TrpC [Actinomycetales bacterium]